MLIILKEVKNAKLLGLLQRSTVLKKNRKPNKKPDTFYD